MSVELVSPFHCSGAIAIAMFASEYEENFIQSGVGKIIKMDFKNP
jgi:metal-dependent hydrolase (beta-lactamase superfamily II)